MKHRKAIALMSGGLDSNLAIRLLHDMGIELIGVHFTGPFCMCNRGTGGCIHYARKIAGELGLEFSTRALGAEYLERVVNPKHGRGSGMNPCLDCRILMFRSAKAMMEERDAAFIVTGEVLGQRPMSQLRDKLRLIEKHAGLEGRILRPLCARHLPPTRAEQEGWVDREALLGIRGRGRRTQMDLADKLALGDYPCPAGGCLLTDKPFAARLREHIDHNGGLEFADIPLLKLGRHFRMPSGSRLILGRDQAENERLEPLAGKTATLLQPESGMGPTAVLSPHPEAETDRKLAAEILSAYCKDGEEMTIAYRTNGECGTLRVRRHDRAAFAPMRV